jgi:hypothetical protein
MDMVVGSWIEVKKPAPIERGVSIARAGNPVASTHHGLVAGLRPVRRFATAMYPPCIREEIPAPGMRPAP